MSESIEMYLLRIALLEQEQQPVPVPLLAQELSVSPVSANEMCRKLTERAFIEYEPYKGVTLTADGEQVARRVLRRRRLWEVFFVDKLGIAPPQAEAMACRFEHVTPEALTERLAEFLNHPRVSPQNEPIPCAGGEESILSTRLLSSLTAGEQGRVVSLAAGGAVKEFLQHQGLVVGAQVEVLATAADGIMLLAVAGQPVSLAPSLAGQINLAPLEAGQSSDQPKDAADYREAGEAIEARPAMEAAHAEEL